LQHANESAGNTSSRGSFAAAPRFSVQPRGGLKQSASLRNPQIIREFAPSSLKHARRLIRRRARRRGASALSSFEARGYYVCRGLARENAGRTAEDNERRRSRHRPLIFPRLALRRVHNAPLRSTIQRPLRFFPPLFFFAPFALLSSINRSVLLFKARERGGGKPPSPPVEICRRSPRARTNLMSACFCRNPSVSFSFQV